MLAPKSITGNSLSSVNSGKSVKHVSVICQTGGRYGRCIVGPYVSERRFLSPADTLNKLRVGRQLNLRVISYKTKQSYTPLIKIRPNINEQTYLNDQ